MSRLFPACGLICRSLPPGSGPPDTVGRSQGSYDGWQAARSRGGWLTAPVAIPPVPKKISTIFKLIRRGADRVSKSWPWSPNMKTLYPEKPAWLVAALRIIFLGLSSCCCFPPWRRWQSAWPSGVPQPLFRVNPRSEPGNLSPPGLRSAALNRENPGRHPACPPVASLPALGNHQDVTVRPASLGRLPRRCPLPPASAFHLQTNLRKYLETWPTPGSTTTEAWPEYVPEDGEDVD